ncbi:MAG: PAS domain-containing protein [Pseudomonadota bacterium]
MPDTSQPLLLTQTDRRERRGVMAALDHSQCLIWFNAQGRILDANPLAQDLLGRHLIDETHALLVGEYHGSWPSYSAYWARIRDGLLRNEERSLHRGTGEEVWTTISYAVIASPTGGTRRVLAIVIDLSPWAWKPKIAF